MKIRPLSDKIVIKKIDEVETVSKGGILLTGSAKEKPDYAEVVAVGPGGRDDNGKLIPMEVKPGDKVMMSKYAGTEVKLDGETYSIIKQSDVLAIVE
ncbi:MAG: co-chaperone GroES [Clostridia bacterium]|nr:co-chaperone GroES [Clostridia bacterium]